MLYLCSGNSLCNKGKKRQRNYKEFVRDTFKCVTCLLYVLWRAVKKARKPPCFVVVILEGHGHCCTKVHLEKYRPIQFNIYVIAVSFFHKSHESTRRNVTLAKVHCWKKKRDFLIIRSKVGGFLILSVADNEYFVG